MQSKSRKERAVALLQLAMTLMLVIMILQLVPAPKELRPALCAVNIGCGAP